MLLTRVFVLFYINRAATEASFSWGMAKALGLLLEAGAFSDFSDDSWYEVRCKNVG